MIQSGIYERYQASPYQCTEHAADYKSHETCLYRKAAESKNPAEESKPYFDCMYATMTSLLAKAGNINHPYLKADDSKKKAVIVVTSNRGLAGGYNSNVVKMVTENEAFTKENIRIYAVGGKGLELLKHKGYDIVADYSEMIEEPSYDDAKSITKRLLTDFENGEIGEIYLIYTFFKNTVSHIPTMIKVFRQRCRKKREKRMQRRSLHR